MKKLGQAEGGAKADLINVREVIIGKFDIGEGKFNQIFVLGKFEN